MSPREAAMTNNWGEGMENRGAGEHPHTKLLVLENFLRYFEECGGADVMNIKK